MLTIAAHVRPPAVGSPRQQHVYHAVPVGLGEILPILHRLPRMRLCGSVDESQEPNEGYLCGQQHFRIANGAPGPAALTGARPRLDWRRRIVTAVGYIPKLSIPRRHHLTTADGLRILLA